MNAWICTPLTTDHDPARVSIKSAISVMSVFSCGLTVRKATVTPTSFLYSEFISDYTYTRGGLDIINKCDKLHSVSLQIIKNLIRCTACPLSFVRRPSSFVLSAVVRLVSCPSSCPSSVVLCETCDASGLR